MSAKKNRLTVTVDADLIKTANKAVADGRADSLSGWVNQALIERQEKEHRLLAAAEAVAEYEAQFGVMTPAEMEAQGRADAKAAVIVRGLRRMKPRSASGRGRPA